MILRITDNNNDTNTTANYEADISSSSSSAQRLTRRRDGNIIPIYNPGTNRQHNNTHGNNNMILHDSNSCRNSIPNKNKKQHHRYYRVQLHLQQQQANQYNHRYYNTTTILLLWFVVISALIGIVEWISLSPLFIVVVENGGDGSTTTRAGAPLSMFLPFLSSHRIGGAAASSNDQWDLTRALEEAAAQQAYQEEYDLNINNNDNKLPDRVLNFNYKQDDVDKEPILKILRQAGVNTSHLDYDTYQQLPSWSQIQQLFGTRPIIYGMGGTNEDQQDHCAAFRNSTDPTMRFFGIAGIFNSGTNLLASLMSQNCQITERMLVYGEKSRGVRWQVPWGKHTPARYRFDHLTKYDADVPPSNSLPLITIRDPYQWMQSMCRHPYTVRGLFSERTCPHLVRIKGQVPWKSFLPRTGKYVSVRVKYSNTVLHHDSLAHFWNEWYQQYMQADFPRIVVRFEDLLFYAEPLIRQLCTCGGGVPRRKNFMHIQASAKVGTKAHGHDKTSLLQAMLLYGNHIHRLDGMTHDDLNAAQQLLDSNLMTLFQYHHPQQQNQTSIIPATTTN